MSSFAAGLYEVTMIAVRVRTIRDPGNRRLHDATFAMEIPLTREQLDAWDTDGLPVDILEGLSDRQRGFLLNTEPMPEGW
jgi:hypothetical protein